MDCICAMIKLVTDLEYKALVHIKIQRIYFLQDWRTVARIQKLEGSCCLFDRQVLCIVPADRAVSVIDKNDRWSCHGFNSDLPLKILPQTLPA